MQKRDRDTKRKRLPGGKGGKPRRKMRLPSGKGGKPQVGEISKYDTKN